MSHTYNSADMGDRFRTLSLKVSNLSYKPHHNTVQNALYDMFRDYGKIQVEVVDTDRDRLGFINFTYERDAKEALHQLQPTFHLFDRVVHLEPAYPSRRYENYQSGNRNYQQPPNRYREREPDGYYNGGASRDRPTDRSRDREEHYRTRVDQNKKQNDDDDHIKPEFNPRATRNLFVGNLSLDTTVDNLSAKFEKYGVIDDVDVKRPSNGPAYAFVSFVNLDYAYAAKKAMNNKVIHGLPCRVGYGKPLESTIIWIGGFGSTVKPETLKKLEDEFDRFGKIDKIYWPNDACKFGFVLYSSLDASKEACEKMRGHKIADSRFLRCDFVNEYCMKLDRGEIKKPAPPPSPTKRKRSKSRTRTKSRTPERNRKRPAAKRIKLNAERIQDCTTVDQLTGACPAAWTGYFVLKNNSFQSKLHLVAGSEQLVDFMHDTSILTITQRLRLEEGKLKEVERRIENVGKEGYSLFLAVPDSGQIEAKVSQAGRHLRNLVTYFKQKDAAGVIQFNSPKESHVVHVFPPCDYAHNWLMKHASKLTFDELKDDYLLVALVKEP